MASPVPAKSQPLHYFSLPQLKWKKNHTNNHHRGRRIADSSSPPQQSPPPDSAPRQSSLLDSASESDSGFAVSLGNSFPSENRKFSPPEGLNQPIEKSDKKSTVTESDADVAGGKERRSKIYIRLPKNKPDGVAEEGKMCSVEESAPKTWNLRPRRPLYKQSNGNGGTPNIGGSPMQENRAQSQQATQIRPESEANTAGKKEKKQKFSIALSREEIDEDLFALTGSKPPRRPKKRSRTVQKQLDNLFPGLWLGLITPDSYKVSEAPAKG